VLSIGQIWAARRESPGVTPEAKMDERHLLSLCVRSQEDVHSYVCCSFRIARLSFQSEEEAK